MNLRMVGYIDQVCAVRQVCEKYPSKEKDVNGNGDM